MYVYIKLSYISGTQNMENLATVFHIQNDDIKGLRFLVQYCPGINRQNQSHIFG